MTLPSRAPKEPVERGGERGYTLAALMILIMVMSIMMAVAVRGWTTYVQREKEQEAIFRGLQYAEAIRVFQQRHGRLPNQLEELIKVEPRSIRQLYPNPLHEGGAWGMLMQSQAPAGGAAGNRRGGQRGVAPASANNAPGNRRDAGQSAENTQGAQTANAGGRRGGGGVVAVPPPKEEKSRFGSGFGTPRQTTTGPIVGVYPGVDGQAIKTFNGSNSYSAWRFQVELIPAPVILGGDAPAPRVTSDWVGKPFRSDIQVQSGGNAPGAGQQGAAGNVPARSSGMGIGVGGRKAKNREDGP